MPIGGVYYFIFLLLFAGLQSLYYNRNEAILHSCQTIACNTVSVSVYGSRFDFNCFTINHEAGWEGTIGVSGGNNERLRCAIDV